MPKAELEFIDPHKLPDHEWVTPAGYPEGFKQLIITEDKETGAFTRLMRAAPGAAGTATLTHETWEEVYIIEGSLTYCGKVYPAGSVAVRPPGMPHGPFSSPNGALMFEVHYRSK